MRNWLLQRLAMICFALTAVFILTFLLMNVLPGDPFLSEQSLPQESLSQLRRHWGLDKPLHIRLYDFTRSIVSGNLGYSLAYPGRRVSEIVLQALPISAFLGLCALTLAVLTGTGTALIATLWNRSSSGLYLVLTTIAVSTPIFLTGALFQYAFAIEGEWLPVARWGTWKQAVLPILTLAFTPSAFIGRLLHSRLQKEMNEPYARFAEAKGLSHGAILCKHVFRNACAPVLAYLGPLTAHIATGSFIVERIYAIPGLGQWFVLSVSHRDYPLIIALALLYCFVLMSCVLLSDLATMWVNPLYRQTIVQGRQA